MNRPYRINVWTEADVPHRWWFFDYLFARFAWYRRWCGGHWERWWIDGVYANIWFQQEECGRRPPLAFGTPVCEDHAAR